MSKKIILKKATRIEGNANIHIEVQNGKVKTARFMVHDFRGFEKILVGRRVEYVPHFISRICGLCSVAHQVASLGAIEDALGVLAPASLEKLREIMVLGELISSHALSYFFLTMPDQAGVEGGFLDLMKSHPDIMKDAFSLRNEGQQIVKLIGKRAVHPISMGVGQFLVDPTTDEITEVSRIAEQIQKRARQLILLAGEKKRAQHNIEFPKDQQVNFFSYDNRIGDKSFTVYNVDGSRATQFLKDDFERNISEMRADWSLAKFPYLTQYGFPAGITLVGPLSRSFSEHGFLRDAEIRQFPLTEKLLVDQARLDNYDICRLLEIFWAAKRVQELVRDIDLTQIKTKVDFKVSGRGIGVVEAPRGVLVHNYLVNNGCIEKAQLLVATQFNNPFINLLIRDLAERHVEGDKISHEGDRRIGNCVRLFDPCLSCATH